MKIMVVAPYFYPQVGGLENYALNISVSLMQQGHQVTVVTSNPSRRRRQIDHVQGLTVIRLPIWFRLSNTPINPLWYWQLRRLFRHHQPDVILAHTPVPFLADMAARAAGRVPFVLTYHNDLAKDNWLLQLIASAFWWLLGDGTARRADRIIATTSYYAHRSPYLKPYLAKTDIIAPAVDTDRFHAGVDGTPVQQQFPGRRIVLFVGSLAKTHAHKGLDLLIEAVARLSRQHSDLQLVAVGRGDNIDTYRKQARRLGIADRVSFPGYVADADLPAYYAAAHVFVLPSTNQAEAFGMVLAEAAACGTAVIGTRVGGVPAALELIGSPNLAEPTIDSLTAELAKVLGDPGAASPTKLPMSWSEAAQATSETLKQARRPRVVLIHNVIAPYRLEMFEQLAATANLEVLFTQVTLKDRAWTADLDHQQFRYRILPAKAIGPVVFNRGGLRALLTARFDLLITNTDPDTAPLSLTALALAKLRRRPVIIWSEVTDEVVKSLPQLAYASTQPRKQLGKILNAGVMMYRQLFFRSSRYTLAFSGQAEAFLRRHGVPQRRIRRTYEVMPLSQLPAAHQPAVRGGKQFLYMGYLSRNKNVHLLIQAFRSLTDPNAGLTIAGSGDEAALLQQLAAGDQRIHFAGFVNNQQRADLYASHDVLVLPTRRDCWGLVVNEALHYGQAVIVTDTAAACELIDTHSGLVIPANDQDALADAMSSLLANPKRLAAMQRHNHGRRDVSNVAAAVEPFVLTIRELTRS